MSFSKSYRLFFILLGSLLIFPLIAPYKPMEIRYSQPATIPFDWDSLQVYSISVTDTVAGEVIQQVQTAEGIPLFYARDIVTGVCFDDKCRPLNLTLYWNITGRYLGFRLPDEEFLSRYDHEPFVPEDYVLLNELLADPHLPLGNVSFEELIQPSEINTDSIDGVSGATSQDVLAYVVEGAAYTTYTMWNIVYGPTQDLVSSRTEEELTPELAALILQSPSSRDKLWAIDQLARFEELDTKVAEALLTIMDGEDFFTAYSAINAITAAHLTSESLQIGLLSKYKSLNHSLGKAIIERLKAAPKISPEVVKSSRRLLADLNGQQLGHVLELYHQHTIYDATTGQAVAKLLKDENRFIAEKAYRYLLEVQTDEAAILQALADYEKLRK